MEKVRLEDVCSKAGSNIAQKDLIDCNGEYEIYGATGLIKKVNFYKQDKPYIAVVKDGAGIGRVFELPEKSSIIGTLQYIIPNKDVDISYLAYAMKRMNLSKYYSGSAIPHIYFKDYKKEKLLLRPITEQKRIADLLHRIEAIINFKRIELEQLDLLIKARFVEMFGDPIENPYNLPIKKLKNISSLITNGNTPKGGSSNYVKEGIIFLRSQNIWRNRIDLEDVAYIDDVTNNSLKKSIVHNKDILITKTGRINTENSSLGRAALYMGADNSANINGHVYLVRISKDVLPEFVVTILTGESYRKYIRRVCVGGIDKRQINLDQVEDFPIIVPKMEKQISFVKILQQIDKSKVAVQKSLDEAQLLYDSLMQKYFD